MEFQMDGYCGLYCGACPAILETTSGKKDTCHGCKTDHTADHCAACEIKACAQQKGYRFCYECSEVKSCEMLRTFMFDERYPYHLSVMKNMDAIQQNGVTVWLAEQEVRWQCKHCGGSFSWWDETCPQCAKPVASYKADL
ncbi:MAG: DUF3795 domain-containing protein [Anaerolineaceae bacterium]|nr:DUF3795 domain-containing protein [Anaerolineaceae bacterium]